MDFVEFIPWLVTFSITALTFIFSRTDKNGSIMLEIQIDIATIRTMVETMQENHGSLEIRQKEKDKEQDKVFKEHREHNSARHKEFFDSLESLNFRVSKMEKGG